MSRIEENAKVLYSSSEFHQKFIYGKATEEETLNMLADFAREVLREFSVEVGNAVPDLNVRQIASLGLLMIKWTEPDTATEQEDE